MVGDLVLARMRYYGDETLDESEWVEREFRGKGRERQYRARAKPAAWFLAADFTLAPYRALGVRVHGWDCRL